MFYETSGYFLKENLSNGYQKHKNCRQNQSKIEEPSSGFYSPSQLINHISENFFVANKLKKLNSGNYFSFIIYEKWHTPLEVVHPHIPKTTQMDNITSRACNKSLTYKEQSI